jgi:SAM-dependent methyltransferase
MRLAKIDVFAKIADIGCGNGDFLKGLYREGFEFLYGVDPFLSDEQSIGRFGFLTNKDVSQLPEEIDFIIMNHSLEHVPDPRDLLRKCHDKLLNSGHLLIRMPVTGNEVYKEYGCFWVGLDAPRHIHVFSLSGAFKILEEANFDVISFAMYTDPYNLWASEQYRRGIPLMAPGSYFRNAENPDLPLSDIEKLSRKAQEMNKENIGDAVTILVAKSK